jgi:hypothetical protein
MNSGRRIYATSSAPYSWERSRFGWATEIRDASVEDTFVFLLDGKIRIEVIYDAFSRAAAQNGASTAH